MTFGNYSGTECWLINSSFNSVSFASKSLNTQLILLSLCYLVSLLVLCISNNLSNFLSLHCWHDHISFELVWVFPFHRNAQFPKISFQFIDLQLRQVFTWFKGHSWHACSELNRSLFLKRQSWKSSISLKDVLFIDLVEMSHYAARKYF